MFGACFALVALSLTVGGFGFKYYQDIQHSGSEKLKRPIRWTLFFGFVVIVGAMTAAALALLGWGGDEAALVVFLADAAAFVIYLVIMVIVIVGEP